MLGGSLSPLPGLPLGSNTAAWVIHPRAALSGCLLTCCFFVADRSGPASRAPTGPPVSCPAGASLESGVPSAAPRSLRPRGKSRPTIDGQKPTPPARSGDQEKGAKQQVRMRASKIRAAGAPTPPRSSGRAMDSASWPPRSRLGAGAAAYMRPAQCPHWTPWCSRSGPPRIVRVW
ncbi:hypothetical protein NDU88_004133 [Pleurodeles waltl]|uniref:Uncharacterized protein n=1 Tax=Pleurodeles waltl TaxID=8319 RepID=A0AAV7RFU5_PLEWA|nr:hypothetical protein NDU88_004133 [Pleurodeles waltl]